MNNLRPERGGRNNAYWYACWTDASGRRRRRSLGPAVKSKAAARRACNALIKQAATDGSEFAAAGKPPSVVAWLSDHLEQHATYAEATAKLYRQSVSELGKWRDDSITTVDELDLQLETAREGSAEAKRIIRNLTRLDSLTRKDAAAFRRHLAKTRSETTTRKIIRTLRALWAEAVRQDLVTTNPWDRQPVTTPAVDKVWAYTDADEISRVLDACPDSAWRAFFAIARYAGPRLNEICRIQFGDIDWADRTITITNPRRHQTTKHRARVVPIAPELYDILRERMDMAKPGETVVRTSYASFNGSLGPGRIAMSQILERAKVPHATPHNLRRSCETDWLKTFPAPDVCKWLGNSIAVAMRHYHKTTPETLARATGQNDTARIAELQAEIERLRERAESVSSDRG